MRTRATTSFAKHTLIAACTFWLAATPAIAVTKHTNADVAWRTSLAAGEQRLALHDLSGAEAYFRDAVKAVQRQTPHTTDDIVYCLQQLGAVLQMEYEREEGSMPTYKRALALETRKYGKQSPRLIPLLNSIGKICAQDANYRQAGKYFARSLKLAQAKELSGQHDPMTLAECEYFAGKNAFGLGDTVTAENDYSAALARLMAQPELPNADLLQQVIADYIDLYMHADEAARNVPSRFQAELLKDKLAALQKTQATPQSNFAKAVSAQLASGTTTIPVPANGTAGGALPEITPDRKIPDASVALENSDRQRIDFYERMIETDIKSLGPKHPSVARDLTGLAAVYIREKNYPKAQEMLAKALQIYSTTYGADALLSKKTAALMELIAEDEQDEKRLAVDHSTGAYITHLPVVPQQSGKLEIALGLNYLAQLLFTYGKTDDAARTYGWALADTVLATGETSQLTAATLADYGKVLRSRGEMKLAEDMEFGSRRILRTLKTEEAVLSVP